MRIAVVCGDGLPVSGLLTILRNVVDGARREGLIESAVHADLGYSWRPDKPGFYPTGPSGSSYPTWMSVSSEVPSSADPQLWASMRRRIASLGSLSTHEAHLLRREIEHLTRDYESYFLGWLEENSIDWLLAINMTLSDAVPVTAALHRAAERRWGGTRQGGIVFWDHDLFGSYAVTEGCDRVYPVTPNDLTPLPVAVNWQQWAVVSKALEEEAKRYSGNATPVFLPNVLPTIPDHGLSERHLEFLAQQDIDVTSPLLLVPMRVFPVKGIEISLRLFAEIQRLRVAEGETPTKLAIFGSLREDPEYSAQVVQCAHDLGIMGHVRFLDGVPLCSFRDELGHWHLDEVDLLHAARATGGAVLFTPSRTDVESVGLGPALAAVADLPVVVTQFSAFDDIYGCDFTRVQITNADDLVPAAKELVTWIRSQSEHEAKSVSALQKNLEIVSRTFPAAPWRNMLRSMDYRIKRGAGQR